MFWLTNDGHDTRLAYGYDASDCARFISGLINSTLVLLTFDEAETHAEASRMFSLLCVLASRWGCNSHAPY